MAIQGKALPTVRVYGEKGPVSINERDFDPSRHLLYADGETKEQAFSRVVERAEAAQTVADAAVAGELFRQVESEDSEDEPVAEPETISAEPTDAAGAVEGEDSEDEPVAAPETISTEPTDAAGADESEDSEDEEKES